MKAIIAQVHKRAQTVILTPKPADISATLDTMNTHSSNRFVHIEQYSLKWL